MPDTENFGVSPLQKVEAGLRKKNTVYC